MLVGSVLLQPGKTDAGEHLFTSNVSSAAASPRGTVSVLSKFTIGAAVVFMMSALMISMPALSGNVSVLQGNAETPAEQTPAGSPASTPGAVPNANTPPTAQTVIEGGQTQTVVIPPDSNANAAVVNMPTNSQAPANKKVTTLVPVKPSQPANK